ncbi:MAG: hypothetical protein UX78_C0002G0018 [Candidatus Amesbacteria bacterium GW2011_GWA2_47_11]|uniref:Uncharacterized protein n=5 Tax=Candidatus Amesiibacteriota TaxID=1752730 RepID=A0A0G1XJV6_9BACT|nr:MAG: hypothetical protein UX78_C0002G0018 [Candidatus Amesbacteria bacterium GW2011_GWA2_47_11]KKU94605.1 MAG: hypothetical protein UY22_C0011G0012 [Candidatus Amesbacteria bacterium GW2011_GWC1_48_10]KKU98861.1 MAG: hypothetical protein UY33_C0043G0005 [Candidatus Amesbacteria bacterium GW2011_GWA1_48_9]
MTYNVIMGREFWDVDPEDRSRWNSIMREARSAYITAYCLAAGGTLLLTGAIMEISKATKSGEITEWLAGGGLLVLTAILGLGSASNFHQHTRRVSEADKIRLGETKKQNVRDYRKG